MDKSNYITLEEIDIAVEGLFSKIKDGTKEISNFISSEKKRTKEVKDEEKREYQLELAKKYPNGLGKKYQHLIDEENKKNEEEKSKIRKADVKNYLNVLLKKEKVDLEILAKKVINKCIKSSTDRKYFTPRIEIADISLLSDDDKIIQVVDSTSGKIELSIQLIQIKRYNDGNVNDDYLNKIIGEMRDNIDDLRSIFKTSNLKITKGREYHEDYGDPENEYSFDPTIEIEIGYTPKQVKELNR